MNYLALLALTGAFIGCNAPEVVEKPERVSEHAMEDAPSGCGSEIENCHADADCTDEGDSFSCACNPGYEGDGVHCENIDECAHGADDCDLDASCTDTEGSYSCGCNPGYEGDGVHCENIDECARGTDDCDLDASCTDTEGSYSCACNLGFVGDGWDCERERCEAPVGDFDGTDNRSITFLAFGDTQISLVDEPGCKQYGGYRADQQERMIGALNGISTQTWPEGYELHYEGRPIDEIRGVLIAGDITENGGVPLASVDEDHVPDAVCDEFTPFETA